MQFGAAAATMVFVWLAAYACPSYRPYIDGKRRLCVFPDTSWFHERLVRAGLSAEAHTGKKLVATKAFSLRALCKIEPGRYHAGVMTPWTAEESFQLTYYRRPLDAYSVTLASNSCWEIEGSSDRQLPLHFRDSAQGAGGVAPVSLKHAIFDLRPEDKEGLQLHKFGHAEAVSCLADVLQGAGAA